MNEILWQYLGAGLIVIGALVYIWYHFVRSSRKHQICKSCPIQKSNSDR